MPIQSPARRIEYRPVTQADVAYVAERMRAADVAEIKEFCGMAPLAALTLSVRASTSALVGTWDGDPVGIFGIVNVNTLEGIGAPWLLGTDRMEGLAREWLRDAPRWLEILSAGYSLLRNWVDARNVRAVRVLRRLGFQVAPAEPRGIHGLAFHKFEGRV